MSRLMFIGMNISLEAELSVFCQVGQLQSKKKMLFGLKLGLGIRVVVWLGLKI